jgi:enoyl-CoA hydratase/carnithine racemase
MGVPIANGVEPSDEGCIRVDQTDSVATITISRPGKHNALSLAMWRQFHDAAIRVASAPSIRVVVIRGEGQDAFSSGADISEFGEVRQNAATAESYSDTIEQAELTLIRSRKPILALLHGICAGGACGIALACTLRFADERFRFSIPAARLGVVYHQTAVDRLVQQVGPSTAMDILMTGRFLAADEAHACGLVDAVYPADVVEERVYEYAGQIAASAPMSVEGAWAGVQAALHPHDAALRKEVARLQSAAHESADYREGIRAFLEKRPPVFGRLEG